MFSAHIVTARTSILLLSVCLTMPLAAAQTTQKTDTSTAAKKKTAVTTASKRPPVKPSTAHAHTAVASHEQSSSRASTKKVVVTRKLVHGHWVRTSQIVRTPAGPSYQTHPDQERYQQIQQALAQKGYFKGEANGQWGDDSVEALKRFQTDRKINNDGKISALSLIGLGLGPNRESAAVKTEDAAPPVAQTSPPN